MKSIFILLLILVSCGGDDDNVLRNRSGVVIDNPRRQSFNLVTPPALQRRFFITYEEIEPGGLFRDNDRYAFQMNNVGDAILQGIRNVTLINPRILNNQINILQWGPNNFGNELRLQNVQTGQFIEIEVYQNSVLIGRFTED